MIERSPIVAVLGDSRVFDTYFTNVAYSERYGYDSTFPHLLRKRALQKASSTYDVVHIPDHFRGGSIETNTIRLALTDPAVVVLCDGIWETLVHKEWFVEWAVARIRSHSTHSSDTLDLSYSSRRLADLFIADELAVSPRKYAEKQRRIVSYFRRRRRQCVWMSLPMPPRDHLDRLHFAGNYRCIPEWDECLRAINQAMAPLVASYGAAWFDLHDLALAHGGFDKALIDQWHFSASFHNAIAEALFEIMPRWVSKGRVSRDHASRRFLLAREPGDEPLALIGDASEIAAWRAENSNAKAEAVLVGGTCAEKIAGFPTLPFAQANRLAARCAVALAGAAASVEAECALLDALPPGFILLYPEELRPLLNPGGRDRSEHGQLR